MLHSKLIPFNFDNKLPDVPYLIKDESFIYPFMKRLIWGPLLERIPKAVSANTMTIVSNIGSILTFCCALAILNTGSTSPILLLLPCLGLFFYLSLDNMDGSQARRTGTSSPLGEFLDHWFDAFNLGLISVAIFLTLSIPPWYALLLMIVACISFFSQYWEQKVTGWLIFGKFGSVEGIMIVVGLYLMLAITGLEWFTTPLFEGWLPLSILTTIGVLLGYLAVPIGCIYRTKKELSLFGPLLVALGATYFWFIAGNVPYLSMMILMVLINGFMAGRLVVARVTGSQYQGFDKLFFLSLLIPIIGSVFLNWSAGTQSLWILGVIGYISFRLVIDFISTVMKLDCFLQDKEFLSLAFGLPKKFIERH